MPVLSAAPCPRLRECFSTWTFFDSAIFAVLSAEPSSTTTIFPHFSARRLSRTFPIFFSSLNAAITIKVFMGKQKVKSYLYFSRFWRTCPQAHPAPYPASSRRETSRLSQNRGIFSHPSASLALTLQEGNQSLPSLFSGFRIPLPWHSLLTQGSCRTALRTQSLLSFQEHSSSHPPAHICRRKNPYLPFSVFRAVQRLVDIFQLSLNIVQRVFPVVQLSILLVLEVVYLCKYLPCLLHFFVDKGDDIKQVIVFRDFHKHISFLFHFHHFIDSNRR